MNIRKYKIGEEQEIWRIVYETMHRIVSKTAKVI